LSGEALAEAAAAPPASPVPVTLAPWAAEFEAREAERAAEPAALRALRARGLAELTRQGLPTIRQEAWRFTNVAPIARTTYVRPHGTVSAAEVAPWLFSGMPHLVLVDGELDVALSDVTGLPTGIRVGSLRAAIADGEPLVARLGAHADLTSNPFAALNTALFSDGALLVAGRGVMSAQPLQVLFVSTGATAEGKPAVSFPRLLIVAEEGSSLIVVERYVTIGEGESLTCAVSEIEAGARAVVDHYRLAQEGSGTSQIGLQQLRCERQSAVTSYSVVTGGALVRQDVQAQLVGEGVDAILNGLYLTRGRQHVDHQMKVEHRAAHCDSHELYKGILEDRSRAVFNGLIHVYPGAQKTDAKQTNRNLLLSQEALVNTNPQLRIFADDVKCTHGSTVGQLDEEAVFYLRSRGISEEAAKSLLTYAFARDVVDRIKAEPVRRDLEELLLQRLPKGDVVRQAI
jgi:Fe-S cluster assembly protein SufD